MARLLAYQSALDTIEPTWTIADVLEGLGLLWGEAGVGKSFVACSLAAAVATGRPWLGHRVKEGAVVYVAGEGGALGVARRLDAAVTNLRCCDADDGPVPLWMTPTGVDLVKGAAELMGAIEDEHVTPQLVIVDTLARCFGGDENTQKDMGAFVSSLDMLRATYGCSLLVVHHANKSDKTGAGKIRGNSALYGAVDVCVQLVPTVDGVKLVADKLRDREVSGAVAELRFESVAVPGEHDELGDERTTRVVRPTAEFEAALPAVATAAMHGPVNYATWREAAGVKGKALFDRCVVAVLGDPETWGVVEISSGVYSVRGN